MAEYLISRGRIGCVPGVDFGANGEGYIRFCFARERRELTGALESMRALFFQRRSAGRLHTISRAITRLNSALLLSRQLLCCLSLPC